MDIQTMAEVGMSAPDFAAVDTEGRPVRLSDLWERQTLIVVFLRHLGCTFCRQHIVNLKKQYPAFRESGAEVVCVGMGDSKVGKAFRIVFELPYPILMVGDDPAAYRLYGLGRGSLRQLLGLRMWAEGFFAMLQLGAQTVGRVIGDGRQMSGTFIVDRSGTIRLTYRGRDAADNPPNQLLLEMLNQLKSEGVALEDRTATQHAAGAV